MKILVLSFYFPPDLSAGSFRTTALVDALLHVANHDSTIDLVTTLPNRYHSFTAEAPAEEQRGRLRIRRIPLAGHRSGKVDQGLSALGYFRRAARAASHERYDVVVATSGRLLTAALGAYVARRVKAPLYLDIRDIFVDNSKEILPRPVSWVLTPVFSAIEQWTVRRASHVNLVSRGFAPYFTKKYPSQKFTYNTNGVDAEFAAMSPPGCAELPGATNTLTVLYAGNLGEAQGLHIIVPPLAKRLGSRVKFKLIGDGSRRTELVNALAAQSVSNVEIIPPMPRAALLEEYRKADVLFVHLNDYAAFRTVLPSKLFECAALGKPLWAGVAGYTAEFVRSEISNSAVFEPCDLEGALRAFQTLRLEQGPRAQFLAKYDRAAISRRMAEDIVAVAGSTNQ